jgi:hypothetical protein
MNYVRVIVELLLFIFVAGAFVTLLRRQMRQAKDRLPQTRVVEQSDSPHDH